MSYVWLDSRFDQNLINSNRWFDVFNSVVEFSDRATCQRYRAIRIRAGMGGRSTSGFLASATTDEYSFGSAECPWIIETLPGQRINVTLLSYASATSTTAGPEAAHHDATNHQQDLTQHHRRKLEVCFEVAVVSDSFERRMVSVCGPPSAASGELDHPRSGGESVVMLSRSNEVRVEIINRHMLRSIGAFMIHYKGNWAAIEFLFDLWIWTRISVVNRQIQ